MRKVTIEEISRRTGLSRGTVSRALNDRPDISPKTKQKVLECCQKLNYVPSHAARSLATGRNYAVAVLVENLHCPLAAAFLRGVISRAESARYVVYALEVERSTVLERLRSLSVERIDGLLNAVRLEPPAGRKLAELLGKRFLASCWPLEGIACDVLTPDEVEAGRLAARYLFESGCTRPIYVHRGSEASGGRRLSGFAETCRAHGVDAGRVTLKITDRRDWDDLGSRLGAVDAIVADDDALAASVMLVCERVGRRPGADLPVIGQGNEPFTALIHPTLSSVDLAGEEIGRRAMELFLQRIDQKRMDAPQLTRVAPFLVHRETTAQLEARRGGGG